MHNQSVQLWQRALPCYPWAHPDLVAQRSITARLLRDTLPVGGRCLLVGGVASQAERPQARSLFPHRAQFGLVLGHCLLALTQLPFFLEQSFGATMRSSEFMLNHGLPW